MRLSQQQAGACAQLLSSAELLKPSGAKPGLVLFCGFLVLLTSNSFETMTFFLLNSAEMN